MPGIGPMPDPYEEHRKMSKRKTKKQRNEGFTLIELLIVIGLLGALTALILPRLTANRQEAIMDISEYNKAGTARVLYQYNDLFGCYPEDMHSGLSDMSTGVRMTGMPKCANFNITDGTGSPPAKPASIVKLTSNEVASLAAVGITSLCYSNGLHSKTLAADDYVVMSCSSSSDQWLHKNFTPAVAGSGTPAKGKITFDGRALTDWITDMNPGGGNDGVIVVCWVAPTTDWAAGSGDNTDWTKGNVEYGISLPGQAPVPTEAAETDGEITFAYYAGHFLVDNDSSDGIQDAKLIGVTCPGGMPLNP